MLVHFIFQAEILNINSLYSSWLITRSGRLFWIYLFIQSSRATFITVTWLTADTSHVNSSRHGLELFIVCSHKTFPLCIVFITYTINILYDMHFRMLIAISLIYILNMAERKSNFPFGAKLTALQTNKMQKRKKKTRNKRGTKR